MKKKLKELEKENQKLRKQIIELQTLVKKLEHESIKEQEKEFWRGMLFGTPVL